MQINIPTPQVRGALSGRWDVFTLLRQKNMEPGESIIQLHIFNCIVNCFFRNILFIKPVLQLEIEQIIQDCNDRYT